MRTKNILALLLMLLPCAGSLSSMEPISNLSKVKNSDSSFSTRRSNLEKLIRDKDVEGVRNFLEHNSADIVDIINFTDESISSMTCLALVAGADDEKSLAIADLLLKQGADVNKVPYWKSAGGPSWFELPLIRALRRDKADRERNNSMLKLLLKYNVRLGFAYSHTHEKILQPLIMVLLQDLSSIDSWDKSCNPIFVGVGSDLALNQQLTQFFKERIKLLLEHETPIPRMYGWVPDQAVNFVNKIIKEINDERLENRRACQALGFYHSTIKRFKDPVLQTLQNVLGYNEDKLDLPLIPTEQKKEFMLASDGTGWVPSV